MFHQVAYAVLTLTTIFRGMYVMEYMLRPALLKRNPAEADQIMTTMWQLTWTGSLPTHICFLGACPEAPGGEEGRETLTCRLCRYPHVPRRLLRLEHGQYLLQQPHRRA